MRWILWFVLLFYIARSWSGTSSLELEWPKLKLESQRKTDILHLWTRSTSDELLIDLARRVSWTVGYAHVVFLDLEIFESVKSWICNLRLVDGATVSSTVFVAIGITAILLRASFLLMRLILMFTSTFTIMHPALWNFPQGTHSTLRPERLHILTLLVESGTSVLITGVEATWFSPTSQYLQSFIDQPTIVLASHETSLSTASFLFYNKASSSWKACPDAATIEDTGTRNS